MIRIGHYKPVVLFPSYLADLSKTKVSEEDTNGQKGDGQQNNETADTMEPIAKKR